MKTIVAKNFFWIFQIFFFEVMFRSDHIHILRENSLEYPLYHIFLYNFLKEWNNVKKNKNHACNIAQRYGALLPIAYFGTQLYCIFYGDVTDVIEYI